MTPTCNEVLSDMTNPNRSEICGREADDPIHNDHHMFASDKPTVTKYERSSEFVGDLVTTFICCNRQARLFAEAGKRKWTRHCVDCKRVFTVILRADNTLEWFEQPWGHRR